MGNDRSAARVGMKLGTGASDCAADHIPDDYPVYLLGAFDDVCAQSSVDT